MAEECNDINCCLNDLTDHNWVKVGYILYEKVLENERECWHDDMTSHVSVKQQYSNTMPPHICFMGHIVTLSIGYQSSHQPCEALYVYEKTCKTASLVAQNTKRGLYYKNPNKY